MQHSWPTKNWMALKRYRTFCRRQREKNAECRLWYLSGEQCRLRQTQELRSTFETRSRKESSVLYVEGASSVGIIKVEIMLKIFGFIIGRSFAVALWPLICKFFKKASIQRAHFQWIMIQWKITSTEPLKNSIHMLRLNLLLEPPPDFVEFYFWFRSLALCRRFNVSRATLRNKHGRVLMPIWTLLVTAVEKSVQYVPEYETYNEQSLFPTLVSCQYSSQNRNLGYANKMAVKRGRF